MLEEMHRNFRSALGAPIGFEAFVEYYKLDRVLFLEKYCALPIRRYKSIAFVAIVDASLTA